MKHIVLPRPDVDEELIRPFREMREVLSLSCVVADAMERENVMRSCIKPRAANVKIIGPAVTVKLTPGDMVDCLDVFTVARSGDVIVIDAFGETETSIWGGLMSGLAVKAGASGAVIDGSCRDTDEARLLDFPISSTAVGPRASHTAFSGRKCPIEINVPIVCGGIMVHPGDLIVADEVGTVSVPYDQLKQVYNIAKEQAERERQIREEISGGATVKDLLTKFGRI